MRVEHFTNKRTDTEYKRITKVQAQKLFTGGHAVIIAPCMVNMNIPYHHFWAILQYNDIDGGTPAEHFNRAVNSYIYYNCCAELGRYPKYFAPAAVIEQHLAQ